MLVEENMSGGEKGKCVQVRWKKNQCAFACTANARLHGTITLVCGAANVHSRVL